MPVSGHTANAEQFAREYANLLRAELSDSSRPWLDRLYSLARSPRVCMLEEGVSDFGAVSDFRSVALEGCVTAGALQKLVNFFDPRVKVVATKNIMLQNAIVQLPSTEGFMPMIIQQTAGQTYSAFTGAMKDSHGDAAQDPLQMLYDTAADNSLVTLRFLNNVIPVTGARTPLGLLWTDSRATGLVSTLGINAGVDYRISTSNFDLSKYSGFATLLYDWEQTVGPQNHKVSVILNRLGSYAHVQVLESNESVPLKATVVTAINVAAAQGKDIAEQMMADFDTINPFCQELKQFVEAKRADRDEALAGPGALYTESYPNHLLTALRLFARSVPKMHRLFLYAKNAPRKCLSPSQRSFLDVAQKLAAMPLSCVQDEKVMITTLLNIGITNAVRTADFMVFLVLLGARVAITLPDDLIPPPQINKGQVGLSYVSSGGSGFCQTASWMMALMHVASKDQNDFRHACVALANLPELMYERLMKALMAFMVGCPFVITGFFDNIIKQDFTGMSIQSVDKLVEGLAQLRKCIDEKLPSDKEAYERILKALMKMHPDAQMTDAGGSVRDRIEQILIHLRG